MADGKASRLRVHAMQQASLVWAKMNKAQAERFIADGILETEPVTTTENDVSESDFVVMLNRAFERRD